MACTADRPEGHELLEAGSLLIRGWRAAQELLFKELTCVSRHRNWVGFDLDVAQLLRVLRAAGANVPEALELKLQQLGSRGQTTATGTAPAAASKPFLTVSAKGQVLDIQQDLPISAPLRSSGA